MASLDSPHLGNPVLYHGSWFISSSSGIFTSPELPLVLLRLLREATQATFPAAGISVPTAQLTEGVSMCGAVTQLSQGGVRVLLWSHFPPHRGGSAPGSSEPLLAPPELTVMATKSKKPVPSGHFFPSHICITRLSEKKNPEGS